MIHSSSGLVYVLCRLGQKKGSLLSTKKGISSLGNSVASPRITTCMQFPDAVHLYMHIYKPRCCATEKKRETLYEKLFDTTKKSSPYEKNSYFLVVEKGLIDERPFISGTRQAIDKAI